MNNHKYLLFSGYDYYPGGGWSDFKGSFATIEDALRANLTMSDIRSGERTLRKDWWHIVDMTTGKIIESSRTYELRGN